MAIRDCRSNIRIGKGEKFRVFNRIGSHVAWVRAGNSPNSKSSFVFSFHGYEPEDGELFTIDTLLFVDFTITDFGSGYKPYWTYHVIAKEPDRGRLYNAERTAKNSV